MKKILILMACTLLILSGCADASANITNGKEIVVSLNNENYTRQELYSFMTNYGGAYFAISNAQKIILDSEVEITEEMENNVDSTLSVYQTMLGDSFESYLQSQGYTGIEQYREMLLQNEQLTELISLYVAANYEELSSRYIPRKIQLMKFDNEETAKEALDELSAGGDFADVAKEKGSLVDGAEQVITSTSSFETVVQYAISTQGVGLTGDVIANDDGSAFYIVKVLSNDAEELKEEAIAVIAANSSMSEEALQYYFKQYDFRVYDIDLYNQLQENYSEFLNQ